MCDICRKNYGLIDIDIIDANGKRTFCPNCLAISFCNDTLNLHNSYLYTCDITGNVGAVLFKSSDEEYFLEKDILKRLISHNLTPKEYFKLADKYGADKYMIHEDFYDEDTGEALQPIE